ncbi:MAG: AAA family ATPase [Methylomicrobium sp.]
MLHSYAFANFQSFAERVEVDLTVKRNTTLTDWMVDEVCGNRVSKLMGVVGHNASGKTALLKPVAFLYWFVAQSFNSQPDTPIPFTPHLAHTDQPTKFECIFDFENTLWRYVLEVTPLRVNREALYQKKERFNYVFMREWNSETSSYDIKQQDFGLPPKIAKKVRQNVSFISWAAQHDVSLAKQFITANVVTNIHVFGRMPISEQAVMLTAEYFSARPEQHTKLNRLLSSWDLGLSEVGLQEVQINPVEAPDQTAWIAFGQHKSGNTVFSLPFHMESSGTQGAFVLLSRLLPVLEYGGLAVIDEFENDLHPHMLEPILDLFANPKTNPYNAQLIFSTHAIEVLNLLEKTQVMLVEKDDECVSIAYRLDTVEGIRNDDNFYAKYMAGAYGAVPNL